MDVAGAKIGWTTIVVGVIGLALGAYLNYLTTQSATQKANDKLFAQIKAEIDSLKAKEQTARRGLSSAEAQRLSDLEKALSVLESRA